MKDIADSIIKALDSNDLLFLFIGVGITLLISAIGWTINSKTEHGKWVRNEKFRIYSIINTVQFTLTEHMPKINEYSHELLSISRELAEISSQLDILGSTQGESNQEYNLENIKSEIAERTLILDEKSEETYKKFNNSRDVVKSCMEQIRTTIGEYSIICSARMFSYLNEVLDFDISLNRDLEVHEIANILNQNRKELNLIWTKVTLTAKVELHVLNWAERLFAEGYLFTADVRTRRKRRKRNKASSASRAMNLDVGNI